MLNELVNIHPYDWSALPACGFFEVLGKRGTGKTSWTQHILQFSPLKPTGAFVVIAGSETAKDSWSKIVPSLFVNDPDLVQLERIKSIQNSHVRAAQKSGTPFPPECQLTLVFDDVSSNKKLMRSPILAYLASNSRHLQMSIFILAQYHCQIVAEVRNQFDLVFLLNTADRKSINRLHAEYCSPIDRRIFGHLLSHCTQNYGMLIIDNQTTSPDVESICFYATQDPYPPILERLGPGTFWEFDDNHYCDEETLRPDRETADAWQVEQETHPNHRVTDRQGTLTIRKTAK